VHQLVTRDSNAFLPGTYQYRSPTLTGVRPNPNLGIVQQFFPQAVFKQNQVILNVNARLSPKFSVFGFYNWTDANTDGGAGSDASNSYNLKQDYGRAAFASTNMVFMMANYTAPWAIRLNPFLIAQSGRPYNVTTANDLTGDNFFNDRPAAVDSSLCSGASSRYAPTQFGCLDTTPANDYTPIGMNPGHGPAAVALNLRISRSFGIGPRIESSGNNGGGPRGPGGPGGGGGGREGGGAPGGSLGPGGMSGGGGPPRGMFGGGGTGHRYSLTFSAQALNLFNDIDYGTPSGVVSPIPDTTTDTTSPGPNFGVSKSLAKGIFASPTSSAARRVFFQAEFSF